MVEPEQLACRQRRAGQGQASLNVVSRRVVAQGQ